MTLLDYIFCKNVFEHIPNPLNFLLEIKRVLKKGGTAEIVTDNSSFILFHWPRHKAYHDTYNETHPIEDQHYFFFQLGHIKAFAKMTNMELIKCDYKRVEWHRKKKIFMFKR